MTSHGFTRLVSAMLVLGLTQPLWAQSPPTWGSDSSPSPTSSSGVSKRANAAANKGMYTEIPYTNVNKQGPQLIVIPGEVKSNNVSFTQKFGSNNIADFAELELSKANFRVLDRADLGPMMSEIQLAYTAGDPDEARNVMKKGQLKTTKWIVRFDILKAEKVAEQKSGFNGAVVGSLLGRFTNSNTGQVASTVTGSVDTSGAAGVWVIGMRYKILDANTTEQLAQNYTEEKMEIGAKSTSIAGVSGAAEGGVSLDTMVQRLVQKSVWDIDNKHK